jgi:hypothetical protein
LTIIQGYVEESVYFTMILAIVTYAINMYGRKIDITVARCGLACEVCKHFNQECFGCEKENELNSRCLIFNCAEEKIFNIVQYLLRLNRKSKYLLIGE